MSDLLRRQRAIDKTLAKYGGQPFEWGKADCIAMARSHLVAMGVKRLPKLPKYRTAIEARAALKAAGHDSVMSLLDSILPRITPAMALPGDLVVAEGDEGLGSISLVLGQKTAGWHEQEPVFTRRIIPLSIEGCWRA